MTHLDPQLGASDDDFFTYDSLLDATEAARRAILEKCQESLVLACPSSVNIKERDAAPALAYYAASLKDMLGFDFQEALQVTAVHLESGRVTVRRAITKKDRPPLPPSTDDEDPGDAYTCETEGFDMRPPLQLDWNKGGSYLVTLLLRDKTSQRVTVRLDKGPGAFKDPEVAAFLESLQPPPAPVFPALPEEDDPEALPRYQAGELSPELPSEAGIALTAQRVAVARAGQRLPVHGSWRLPITAKNRVPAPDTEPPKDATWTELPEYGEPRPAAIVPISLVIIGTELAGPFKLDLRVPSYDALGPEATEASGSFTVDLLPNLPVPQTYFLYAFSGEQMAGPVTLATVAEGDLP